MRAFNEVNIYDACDKFRISIRNEIEGQSKEYLLGIDEEKYKTYLYDKYKLEPLTINLDKEILEQPIVTKEWREDSFYRERYQTEAYNFTFRYPYTGSSTLFKIHPSSWSMTSYDIDINETRSLVSLSIKIFNQSVDEFNKAKLSATNSAFTNLENANRDARNWNAELLQLVNTYLSNRKAKLLKENDFFAAINLKIDKGTESIFTAPVVKKINIPQPTVSKTQQFSSVPTLSTTIYDDILKVIYEAGRSMERKPSLYIGKDEEALRDLFLYNLETRYDSVTATGETFNSIGKTDIMLKYAVDGSNLFIAECKFWHGPQGFIDTINQLFDRYLTWRDTKVAIMMFVRNKDFTSALKNIATEARLHPYFTKDNGRHGDTSFSFIYGLPNDHSQPIFLEIMAFHYDKV